MKKILFATTALVASAGFAAADVNITGSAEIGIVGGSDDAKDVDVNTQFHTDIDVVFSMSGEADNGLTFGATVDLDESEGAAPALENDADDGGAVFFVAYGNARLDMGDTDGALDAVMQEVALVAGSIADDETLHAGYNGNATLDGTEDGQIARFSYTFDAFTGHLSIEQGDNGASGKDPVTGVEADEDIWGLGVRYSAELSNLTLGVGLGYQSQNDMATAWGISVDTAFANGLTAAVNYSEINYDDDLANDATQTHWAIGVGYTMNALSIGVNYGEYTNQGGDENEDNSGFGLAASYDLGGGLTAQLGYGSSNYGKDSADDDRDSWSLGLAMSF